MTLLESPSGFVRSGDLVQAKESEAWLSHQSFWKDFVQDLVWLPPLFSPWKEVSSGNITHTISPLFVHIFFSVGWKFPFRSLLCWWLCSIKQIQWNTHLNDTSQSWFCVCSVWPKDHRDIHLPHAGLREKVWVSIRWEISYVAWNWKFYFLCIADSQSQATFIINAETCEPGSAATLVHSFGS